MLVHKWTVQYITECTVLCSTVLSYCTVCTCCRAEERRAALGEAFLKWALGRKMSEEEKGWEVRHHRRTAACEPRPT